MKRKLSSAFNNNWSINNFINDEIGYDGKKNITSIGITVRNISMLQYTKNRYNDNNG